MNNSYLEKNLQGLLCCKQIVSCQENHIAVPAGDWLTKQLKSASSTCSLSSAVIQASRLCYVLSVLISVQNNVISRRQHGRDFFIAHWHDRAVFNEY